MVKKYRIAIFRTVLVKNVKNWSVIFQNSLPIPLHAGNWLDNRTRAWRDSCSVWKVESSY